MVLAFFISTVSSQRAGDVRVLFFTYYGQYDGEQETGKVASSLRAEKQAAIQRLAERLQSEAFFRRSVSGRTVEEELSKINADDTLPDFDTGFFRLSEEALFGHGSYIAWLAAGHLGVSLVVGPAESRAAAESTLRLLTRYMQEHVHVLTTPVDAGLRTDRVAAILSKLLPGGHLILRNHRLLRQEERELDALMKSS